MQLARPHVPRWSWLFVTSFALLVACSRTKAQAPEASVDSDASGAGDAGTSVLVTGDAAGGDLGVSGSVDLGGTGDPIPEVAPPGGDMVGAAGETLSKDLVTDARICFAPNSAKLPADHAAKIDIAVKRFKGTKSAKKRLGVEPTITPTDKQSSASNTRAKRTAAVVAALAKKGIDRKSIVVLGPEVPRTEWSVTMVTMPGMAFDKTPCVELSIMTKETGGAGSGSQL